MRIAYVCADIGVPVFGRKGNSIHVQEVIRAMAKKGIEVHLFAARAGGEMPPDLVDNVTLHELPKIPKGDPETRERASFAANKTLYAMLDFEGPFDLIYERYSLWSFAGMEYAADSEIPGLLEVNAPLIEEQARHRDLTDRVSASRVAERAFGDAAALLPVSGEVARYLNSWPMARGRVHTVPNGVNADRFPEDAEPSLPSDDFTVGFVGTLKPWHGLQVLVEAFDKLHEEDQNVRLLVVGDGPERENIESELASKGLSEKAHFTGSVGPEEVPGLLASMDVATAPYPMRSDFYFSPLKVFEYMAAGLPVASSRIGQLDGLILDRQNGLLCPAGDPYKLAGALKELKEDPDLRTRLGAEARKTVMADHTWDAIADTILKLAEGKPAETLEASV
ncbi:MAG: glycosyltransferase family 4 protein [Rubrobacteraceae bacterium]